MQSNNEEKKCRCGGSYELGSDKCDCTEDCLCHRIYTGVGPQHTWYKKVETPPSSSDKGILNNLEEL